MRGGPAVRIALPAVICLATACGGSSHPPPAQPKDPHDAEVAAAQAREDQLEKEKPKEPYEVRQRTAFQPGERCGQGPYRLETDALDAKYGEKLVVYACGKHDISGNYRLTARRPHEKDESSEYAFGFDRENQACKGSRATVVQGAPGSIDGNGAGDGSAGGAGGPVAAPAKIQSTELARAEAVPADCAWRTEVLDHGWEAYDDTPPVPAKTHFVIDIWSDEPNDLEGLVFVIEQQAVVGDMTVERWHAYNDAYRAWYDRYHAFVEGEVKAGRSHYVDNTVKTPPPPAARAETPPPRPSQNARWVPGYWHPDGNTFHWIAGFWDVPESDVAKDLTMHAPAPPPAAPPAPEVPTEQPAAIAVWVPGYWLWNGRGWLWVAGAWRIPPSPRYTWRPAGWVLRRGGAVFAPGGWRVRLR